LGAVTKDLLAVQGELGQARAEIQDLLARVEEAPEEIIANKARESDQTWSGIRQRVYELEAQEKRLAASFTDNNPKLGRLREELQGARGILAKMDSERVNQSTTPNPQRIRLQEDLQKLQTKVIGLEKMAAVKGEQRATVHQAIDALIDFELNLAELNRNISLLEGNLQTLRQKQEESRVIDALQGDRISNISSFQPATFVERPVSPKKPLIAVGLPMLGLCVGFGLGLLREFGNTKLRTATHIEQKLRTPVIARVEKDSRLSRLANFVNATDSNLLRQECKAIVSEILLAGRGRGTEGLGRTIGIVGVDEGCGASTLAAALAMTSAEECGLRTTLIDADLKSRSLSNAFSLNGEPGLSELLSGVASHKECAQSVNRQGLDVISGCSPNSAKSLVVDPQAMQATLRELRDSNDLVVFDLPPANRPDQAIAFAQHLDFVVVVVEAERTDEQQAHRVIRRLEASHAEVMGVVLNKATRHLPRWVDRLVS
jgi:tyrosine-protein kinase Etk/Wzc